MSESLPRFEDAIEAHHDEIYRYLWRLLDSAGRSDAASEAHDLTQDVFLRAYRAYERLAANSNVRAWLYKIATNCAMSTLKRDHQGARQVVPFEEENELLQDDGSERPDMQVLAGEAIESVREAIQRLPDKQRAVVVMRYMHGVEYAEIAEILSCSEDSARANVYQALKRLRVVLAEEVSPGGE
jgi:RNA polymerase sigma-70 factor, ECF subfamily